MKANEVVGIARLVLYRRERAVLLEPQGKGIVLWTLRYGDEVRDPIAELDDKAEIDSKLLTLMTRGGAPQTIQLTSTLTAMGLQIVSAHISTYGERVVDVFYVKDVFGLKVRFNASNLADGMSMWDRTVYADRRDGQVDFRQMRNQKIGPIFAITIGGKF